MPKRFNTKGVITAITFIEGDHHSGSGWYLVDVVNVLTGERYHT